jgi:hypothetical protein
MWKGNAEAVELNLHDTQQMYDVTVVQAHLANHY